MLLNTKGTRDCVNRKCGRTENLLPSEADLKEHDAWYFELWEAGAKKSRTQKTGLGILGRGVPNFEFLELIGQNSQNI